MIFSNDMFIWHAVEYFHKKALTQPFHTFLNVDLSSNDRMRKQRAIKLNRENQLQNCRKKIAETQARLSENAKVKQVLGNKFRKPIPSKKLGQHSGD